MYSLYTYLQQKKTLFLWKTNVYLYYMKQFLHIEYICLVRCGSKGGGGERVFLRCGYTSFGTQTNKYPNTIEKWYKKYQEMCLDVLGQTFNLGQVPHTKKIKL